MMSNRMIIAGTALLVLAANPALAAPFPAVNAGFAGTEFRGVALGQSRAEVEAALGANGFRCLTAAEYRFGPREDAGYTTCPIAKAEFVLDQMGEIEVMVRYDLQQKLMLPYYAVSFIDGVASAITLETGYFNADGTTPYIFATQIIENYGLPNGMMPYGSGWRGTTANDEEVQVQTLYNGRVTVLVVTAATDQSTPTFD
jgi:hypothetical protein